VFVKVNHYLPFLFSMDLNDIEEYYMLNDFDGIDLGLLKLFFTVICRGYCDYVRNRVIFKLQRELIEFPCITVKH